jgi:hypothetical protein
VLLLTSVEVVKELPPPHTMFPATKAILPAFLNTSTLSMEVSAHPATTVTVAPLSHSLAKIRLFDSTCMVAVRMTVDLALLDISVMMETLFHSLAIPATIAHLAQAP